MHISATTNNIHINSSSLYMKEIFWKFWTSKAYFGMNASISNNHSTLNPYSPYVSCEFGVDMFDFTRVILLHIENLKQKTNHTQNLSKSINGFYLIVKSTKNSRECMSEFYLKVKSTKNQWFYKF